MKKATIIRAVSVALTAVLAAALFSGCTGGENGNPKWNDGTKKYEPPISLTFSAPCYVQYQPVFDEYGWDMSHNGMLDDYRDNLGIKFVLDIDVNDIGVYYQKLASAVAAGSMSDIVMFGDVIYGIPIISSAEKNGLLGDLTEIIENYASDEVEDLWQRAGEEIFYPGTFSGKVKTLPWVTMGSTAAYTTFYVRQDWLDNCGITAPTDIDGFTEMLRSFTKKDPNNNGEDDTYGLIMGDQYLACTALFNMFGAYPNSWVEDENGDLVFGATLPAMKDALSTLSTWYQEGLIYDFINDNVVEHYLKQQFSNGAGGVYCGTLNGNLWSGLAAKNSEAEVSVFPAFSATGDELIIESPANGFIFQGVSANCKYPESIMHLYNYYYSLLSSPDNYEKYFKNLEIGGSGNTYPMAQFSPVRTYDNNTTQSKVLLEAIRDKSPDGLNSSQLDIYERYTAVESDRVANRKSIDLLLQYSENGCYDIYNSLVENGSFMASKFFATDTPAMTQYGQNLKTQCYIWFNEIIGGVQTVDAFDNFVDTWYSLGGREITDEVNAWYDTVKGE